MSEETHTTRIHTYFATHFGDFWSQCRKIIKSNLVSTYGATDRTCLNHTSWNAFCQFLEPKPGNSKIELPGTHFALFWSQAQKMLKLDLLDLILSSSGTEARKCLNRAPWTLFCRLPEPKLENAEIKNTGPHFVDFWSHPPVGGTFILHDLATKPAKQYAPKICPKRATPIGCTRTFAWFGHKTHQARHSQGMPKETHTNRIHMYFCLKQDTPKICPKRPTPIGYTYFCQI